MRYGLVPILALALLVPAGGASPLDEDTEHVSDASWWDATGYCGSSVQTGLFYLDGGLTSSLTHHAVEGGTEFALHLDAPLDRSCDALDIEFFSPISWPAPGEAAEGQASLASACGATGSFSLYADAQSGARWVYAQVDAPASCGWSKSGQIHIGFVVYGSDGDVCVDRLIYVCGGATVEQFVDARSGESGTCRDGSKASYLDLIVVDVVKDCWGGRQEWYVGPSQFSYVYLHGGPESCYLQVSGFGLPAVDCPSQVGALVWSQDWNLLP